MKYFAKILIIVLIQMNASNSLLAANMGGNDIKVTIYLTNSIISVGATNIPAQVTIENTSKEGIVFYFATSELIGRGVSALDFIIFEAPQDDKVLVRKRYGQYNLGMSGKELKPGEKYSDDVDLGKFLEFTEVGKYEVGFNGNLRLYPEGYRVHRKDKPYQKNEERPGRVVPFHGVIKVTVQEKRPF